ncbi:hypothetical protein [Pseudomonas sp. 9Ag]|uniref:hypothetical protein n=1 Tax=Pseudomonas sp. 9Ag TaxID=2653167 RepID=UPI00135B0A39|nr:hypothetical protein [Pseudomonas sp. 9Ag]
MKELWPDEDGYGFSKRIDKLLNSSIISNETIVSCWTRTTEQANPLTLNFFYAKLYQRAAIKELEQKNNLQAEALSPHLAYYLGFVSGYAQIIENAANSLKGPSHGGQATKKIRTEVEDHLVELLKSPPSGAWKSAQQAAAHLEKPLDDFIKSSRFDRVVSDTADFILKSLSKRGIPKTTYQSHQKRPPKTRA